MVYEQSATTPDVDVEALADGVDQLIQTGIVTIEAAVSASAVAKLVRQANRVAVLSRKLKGSSRVRCSTLHTLPSRASARTRHASLWVPQAVSVAHALEQVVADKAREHGVDSLSDWHVSHIGVRYMNGVTGEPSLLGANSMPDQQKGLLATLAPDGVLMMDTGPVPVGRMTLVACADLREELGLDVRQPSIMSTSRRVDYLLSDRS